jgi:hypothetical protein
MVFTKVKAVGSIIIILRHLRSFTSRLNFSAQNVNIDSVYIKPDTWNVCTNFKEAQSLRCINHIIKPFYNINSWTLSIQEFIHIIDMLIGKLIN